MLLSFGFAVAGPVPADSGVPPRDKRIGELIKQLGSNRFSEREKAGRELETIGEPAVDDLRKAAREGDLETSRRATEILRHVEEKLTLSRLLAPKRLRLKLADVPVLDAVRALEKQSGYKIVVQGDAGDQKVTLDTGMTTFWEALDQLCTRAGLSELSQTPPMPMPGMQPPAGFPRIRVKPALPGGILPVVPPGGKPGKAPLLQVQPAQLRPPGVAMPPMPGMVMPFSGPITLTLSKVAMPPTSYAGAVRVRLTGNHKWRTDELTLTFDAAAEPGVQGFSLEGTPRLDLARDDQGQKLQLASHQGKASDANRAIQMRMNNLGFMPMAPMMSIRTSNVRLNFGEKQAKVLKELKGALTARALAPPQALITVDNILKAGGRTVKGAHGGSIQVQGVEQLANGDYQLKVRLENLPGSNPGAMMMAGGGMIQMQRIQIQVGGNIPGNLIAGNLMVSGMPFGRSLPELNDKNGKPYQLVSMPSTRMSFSNGQMTQEVTLHFRAAADQGAPDRLVYNGRRMVTFPVEFSFKNIPLP